VAKAGSEAGSKVEMQMKGVVFLGDRQLGLEDFEDPAPGPGEVVLQIKASGMCGTDLKYYRAGAGAGAAALGLRPTAGPVIAGHEPCGVVVAVGAGVPEKQARIGMRVMQHHYLGCGACPHTDWASRAITPSRFLARDRSGFRRRSLPPAWVRA
jgi:threonine dehydrogenase-like Zn-dependent dehydrogenase